jgi:hypothetical protein
MDSDWNTSAAGDAGVLSLVGDDRNSINEDINPLLGSRKRTSLTNKDLISSHPSAILYGKIITRTANTNTIAVHHMKVYMGSRGTAPFILNLNTRWR